MQKPRIPTAAELRAQVWSWNRENPPGTLVTYRRDDGTARATRTRSEAYALGANSQGEGGHTAVVLLDAYPGCRPLSRVRPMHGVSCACERCRGRYPARRAG